MPPIAPEFHHLSSRYRALDMAQRYYESKQYEHKPDWYEGRERSTGAEVPLRERAPCVIEPLPRSAVNQAVRFAVGEGKFPELKVAEVEPEDAIAPSLAISKDDAQMLSRALAHLIRVGRLKPAVMRAMRRGLSSGTAVLVLSVKNGRISVEHPHARDCIPTFENNDPDQPVVAMTWVYQYDAEEPDKDGRPTCRRRFFRRDYTESEIIEYQPVDADFGKAIKWEVASTSPHKLGFCPVIWVRNLPEDGCDSIDGVSLYAGLYPQLDALNFSVSQRHMGLETLGVPQPYVTGNEDNDGPAATGRSATPDPANALAKVPRDPYSGSRRATRDAIRWGSKYLWRWRSKDAQFGLVETTGKAFEVASKHVAEIRARLLQAMSVVLMDANESVGKGDMSAKALALLFAPLLALVDELREHWWCHCIEPLLTMSLRIVGAVGAERMSLPIGNRIAPILRGRMMRFEGEERDRWVPPEITPLWGAYFSPSAAEIDTWTRAVSAAKGESLISHETAVRAVAADFGVSDVEAELEAMDDDAHEGAEAVLVQPQEPKSAPMAEAEDDPEADHEESAGSGSPKPPAAPEA